MNANAFIQKYNVEVGTSPVMMPTQAELETAYRVHISALASISDPVSGYDDSWGNMKASKASRRPMFNTYGDKFVREFKEKYPNFQEPGPHWQRLKGLPPQERHSFNCPLTGAPMRHNSVLSWKGDCPQWLKDKIAAAGGNANSRYLDHKVEWVAALVNDKEDAAILRVWRGLLEWSPEFITLGEWRWDDKYGLCWTDVKVPMFDGTLEGLSLEVNPQVQ